MPTEIVRVRKGQRLHIGVDEGEILDLFEEIAEEAVQEAIVELRRGNRTGKYRPDGKRRSVKGEAPHSETGALVQSLKIERDTDSVKVVSTSPYAAFHEENGRPFIGPAIDEANRNENNFDKIIKTEAR